MSPGKSPCSITGWGSWHESNVNSVQWPNLGMINSGEAAKQKEKTSATDQFLDQASSSHKKIWSQRGSGSASRPKLTSHTGYQGVRHLRAIVVSLLNYGKERIPPLKRSIAICLCVSVYVTCCVVLLFWLLCLGSTVVIFLLGCAWLRQGTLSSFMWPVLRSPAKSRLFRGLNGNYYTLKT